MDLVKVGRMLDRLMIAKNRPILNEDAKIVWVEELQGRSEEAIAYAVKRMIRTPGPFPEVANIIELAKEYRAPDTEAARIEDHRKFEHAIGIDKKKEIAHDPKN